LTIGKLAWMFIGCVKGSVSVDQPCLSLVVSRDLGKLAHSSGIFLLTGCRAVKNFSFIHGRTLLGGLFAFVVIGAVGCGDGEGDKPGASETEQQLRRIARVYGTYQGAHRGAVAANEQELKDWIASLPEEQQKLLGMSGGDSVWVSPRDNQPFVIRFGQEAGPPAMGPPSEVKDPILVHEKTGQDGKRYVVFNSLRTALLDQTAFEEALKQ